MDGTSWETLKRFLMTVKKKICYLRLKCWPKVTFRCWVEAQYCHKVKTLGFTVEVSVSLTLTFISVWIVVRMRAKTGSSANKKKSHITNAWLRADAAHSQPSRNKHKVCTHRRCPCCQNCWALRWLWGAPGCPWEKVWRIIQVYTLRPQTEAAHVIFLQINEA